MKINFKRLDHVQLIIPKGSEEKARKFYGGLLGLEEIEKPESLRSTGGVWYEFAGGELHLGARTPNEIILSPDVKRNPGSEHPAFEIENLEAVKEFMKKENVCLKEEIPIPGRNRFSFYDPFGNRIELLEYDE